MANLYGYKFTSQFGEEPHDDWVTVLVGVTGRQIADGLNRCLDEFPEWPPGAAQFRALCIDLQDRETLKEREGEWQLNSQSHMTWDDPRRPENDPSHPNYLPKQEALPDLSKQETCQSAGSSALEKLKADFKNTPDPFTYSDLKKRARRPSA